MKKTFSPDTTAAAELFTTPTQPAPAAPAAPLPTVKPCERLTPPPKPAGVLSWRALPDGEPRSRRLQITCKPSIASAAAQIARANGISLNYLFELLVSDAWREATSPDEK